MIKVSVVVPIYNSEKTLRAALCSLTAQTYKNIEVIAVDDGSTDGSFGICGEFAARDERIKAFRLENRGAAAARNFGIEQSSGDYIMFLDSDDEYIPRAVETMVKHAEKSGSDIVCGGITRVENGKELPASNPKFGGSTVTKDARDEVIEELCLGNDEPLCSFVSKIYSSALIKGKNIRFPLIMSGEDTVFAFESMICADSCLFLENFPFYRYIRNPESFTQRSIDIEKRMAYSTAFFEEMEGVLEKYGLQSMKEALSSRRALSVYDFVMNTVSNCAIDKKKKRAALSLICADKYYTEGLSGVFFDRHSFRVKLISRLASRGREGMLYGTAGVMCKIKKARRALFR